MATHYNGTEIEKTALDAFTKLNRATQSVATRCTKGIDDAGLTDTQFGILELLYHTGSQCQKSIGKRLLKSGGNITLVIDNLEKAELVQRTRGRADRRFYDIHLTGKGEALIKKVFQIVLKDIVKVFSVLTPSEQIELARLTKKLGLGKLHEDG
ncbi:MAG: MarR family winged helix-turn-helix transcriptional regulator [Fidelibacterota bacterium]